MILGYHCHREQLQLYCRGDECCRRLIAGDVAIVNTVVAGSHNSSKVGTVIEESTLLLQLLMGEASRGAS